MQTNKVGSTGRQHAPVDSGNPFWLSDAKCQSQRISSPPSATVDCSIAAVSNGCPLASTRTGTTMFPLSSCKTKLACWSPMPRMRTWDPSNNVTVTGLGFAMIARTPVNTAQHSTAKRHHCRMPLIVTCLCGTTLLSFLFLFLFSVSKARRNQRRCSHVLPEGRYRKAAASHSISRSLLTNLKRLLRGSAVTYTAFASSFPSSSSPLFAAVLRIVTFVDRRRSFVLILHRSSLSFVVAIVVIVVIVVVIALHRPSLLSLSSSSFVVVVVVVRRRSPSSSSLFVVVCRCHRRHRRHRRRRCCLFVVVNTLTSLSSLTHCPHLPTERDTTQHGGRNLSFISNNNIRHCSFH